MNSENHFTGSEIAIIGIAGRFPGANNLEEFWENISSGKESISFIDKEVLKHDAALHELISHPDYVNCAGGVLENKERFDAEFFGYSPIEAQIMDPQVRLFHEIVWEALENACINPTFNDEIIGLYASASSSFSWQAKVLMSGKADELGEFSASNLSNRDLLSTHVSYKLNLTGPSLIIQTTCSSSLVAVHEACQSILNGECTVALAGGVSINGSKNYGYIYQDGMIKSPDGHCRAFDKDAKGTIAGEGVGVVVLKALEDAIEDKDHIYAVIKGSAVNNDGKLKLGFTAPSIAGQKKVIQSALQISEVEPESITYVEAHGTGTELGDPIEIEALRQAYNVQVKSHCAIGSVKTNIGHLDSAAGIAGLIKSVLSLHHKTIPASLNFKSPNPKIDFDNTSFYVNTTSKKWNKGVFPRRAAVSSFGVGGTNAHVILEEAPIRRKDSSPSEEYKILTLSAKTDDNLRQAQVDMLDYLKATDDKNFSDICFNLHASRVPFYKRWAKVCTNKNDAIQILSKSLEVNEAIATISPDPEIVFMFPGQGAQYHKMCYDLYIRESFFKDELDKCFSHLAQSGFVDAKATLFEETESKAINETQISQPLLFVVEYCFAKLLIHWGIKPKIMIGHSLGEYVAATLSGVFTVSSAIVLMVKRGQLMQQAPAGKMISVSMPADEIKKHLDNTRISIAAINNDSNCVLSGPIEDIENVIRLLEQDGRIVFPLHTSHAFHSSLMNEVAEEFKKEIQKIKLQEPTVPFISNLTGKAIRKEEAVSPQYWTDHLLNTVQFSEGISNILKYNNAVLIEVGPGTNLSSIVKGHQAKRDGHKTFNTLRHVKDKECDLKFLYRSIASLWEEGININWKSFHNNVSRGKLPIPTYPFLGERYWIEDISHGNDFSTKVDKKKPLENWFYYPLWSQGIIARSPLADTSKTFYLFAQENALSHYLTEGLQKNGHRVILVSQAKDFQQIGAQNYKINPEIPSEYSRVFEECEAKDISVLYLWSLVSDAPQQTEEQNKFRLFDHPLFILKSLNDRNVGHVDFISITKDLFQITGNEKINPDQSLPIGLLKVAQQEFPNLRFKNIDVSGFNSEKDFRGIINEINSQNYADSILAYRNGIKWIQKFEPIQLSVDNQNSIIKYGGVYLITGGLGQIGLTIAEYLTKNHGAMVVLVGKSPFPKEALWEEVLQEGTSEKDRKRITALRRIKSYGGKVLVKQADVTNFDEFSLLVAEVENSIGSINGVFHTAAITDNYSIYNAIDHLDAEKTKPVIAPKVLGTEVIAKVFENNAIDFLMATSSLSAILGGLGFGLYASGNCFMDHFISAVNLNNNKNWVTINFDGWNFERQNDRESLAILPEEGTKVLEILLSNLHLPQVLVSTTDLDTRLKNWTGERATVETKKNSQKIVRTRPELSKEFEGPVTPLHHKLVEIFNNYFHFDRIGIKDSFFELGGDSLLGITIISKILQEFKVKVSIKDFYEDPCIDGLADKIEKDKRKKVQLLKHSEAKEYYELSAIQKRIYFSSVINPDSVNYNLSFIFQLAYQLDEKQMTDVFRKLIERHEILRTSFKFIAKAPKQVIERNFEFEVAVLDAMPSELEQVVNSFIKPFDLSKGPLFRVAIIRVNGGDNLLLLDIHHIISDAVSNHLIFDELVKLSSNEVLKFSEFQYRDFSTWHNHFLKSDEIRMQEKYWLEQYKGHLPILHLQTDFPRPQVQQFDADTLCLDIEGELYKDIKRLLKDNEITLFIYFLSVVNILLSKYTANSEILVGTEIAGRQHPGLEKIVGMFVGLLPLKNDVAEKRTFREFLKSVRKNVIDAFENSDYQFDDLIRKLGLKGSLNSNPLFNIIVSVDNISITNIEREVEENTVKQLSHQKSNAIWDMRFGAAEVGSKVVVRLTYATSLFKKGNL